MKKLRNRLLSMMLVMAMVITLLPAYGITAFAEEPESEIQINEEEKKEEESKEEKEEEPKEEEKEGSKEEEKEEPEENEEKKQEIIVDNPEEDEQQKVSAGVFDDLFSSEYVAYDTYTTGQKVTFNGSTYKFGGWYTGRDGEGTRLNSAEEAAENTVYYAKWISKDGVTVTTTQLDFTQAEVRAQYAHMKNGIRIKGNDQKGYRLTLEDAVIDCRTIDKSDRPNTEIIIIVEPQPEEQAEEGAAAQSVDGISPVISITSENDIDVSSEEYSVDDYKAYLNKYFYDEAQYSGLLLPDNTKIILPDHTLSYVYTGIYSLGSLEISGEGKLNVSSGLNASVIAVKLVNDANISIVNTNYYENYYENYYDCSYALIVYDLYNNGRISSTSRDQNYYSIGIMGCGTITNYGYIKAKSGNNCYETTGIWIESDIYNYGHINSCGGDEAEYTYGIYICSGGLENRGDIDAVSGANADCSYGIYADSGSYAGISNYGNMNIEAGGEGYDASGIVSYGKLANYGNINIKTAPVLFYSNGIFVYGEGTSSLSDDNTQSIENAALYNEGEITVSASDIYGYNYGSRCYTFGVYVYDGRIAYNEGTITATAGNFVENELDVGSISCDDSDISIASGIIDLTHYQNVSCGMCADYLVNTGKISAVSGNFDVDIVDMKSYEAATAEEIETTGDDPEVIEIESYYGCLLCGLYSDIINNEGSIKAAGGDFPEITTEEMSSNMTLGICNSYTINTGKITAEGGTTIQYAESDAVDDTGIISELDEAETLDEAISIMGVKMGNSGSMGMLSFGSYTHDMSVSNVISDVIVYDVGEPISGGLVYNTGDIDVSGDTIGLFTTTYYGEGNLKAAGNYSAINKYSMLDTIFDSRYCIVGCNLSASANYDGTGASDTGINYNSSTGELIGFDNEYFQGSPKYFSATVAEYNVTTASRIEGTDKSGGRVRGGSKRATYRNGVTVTAEDKKGYDFIGWYIGYSASSNGTPVSSDQIDSTNDLYTDKTIKYYPLSDTVLTAVYKPQAVTSVTLKIKAPNYTITGADGTQQGKNTYTYKPGDTVTVKFTDDSFDFKCWRDKNGKKVSTNSEYTFTISKDTELTAEYSKKPVKKASKSQKNSRGWW